MQFAQDELTDLVTTATEHCDGVEIEKAYVTGFLVHRRGASDEFVALIRKIRPDWQRGLLNGIGGKIEPGETALFAMRREFEEETGAAISDWRCFAALKHGKYLIYMFVAFADDYVELKATTAEEPGWYHVSVTATRMVVPNLRWLVPLAISDNKEIAVVADDAPFPEPRHE